MSILGENSAVPQASIAPWLAVNNAAKAADFYKSAFGASELYRLEDDNGHLVIVHLSVLGAEFWLQEDPEFDAEYVRQGSFRLIVTLDNPDALFERALASGATEIAAMSEGYGWRIGRVVDPFGYHWEIGVRL
ncbi:VOC family protein [Paenibacillus roseipurpureus]|uniref:VOC family protein n=1 Tax=Paenibacillus roseopurpureus TaxID=2918901 RepID=A0AA96RJF4_9BACL|nr:VOC family protein [Paenibacillus sp. MBLB1832]WNR43730.1 VOC family protein [Paenibacillus sp. MBLB1832]